MKRIIIGALLASVCLSQSVVSVDAKTKPKKKAVTQVDRDQNKIPDSWQSKYHLGYGKTVATADRDRDRLTNLQEYQLQLNPTKKDTDDDRLADGQEDADRDRVTNQQEYLAKLNPLKKDTDQDGISDAAEDQDVDNLTTEEEFIVGTQPVQADSDRDGLKDGEEDRDKDQLINEDEFELGSDPTHADSDRDGVRDDQEDADQDGVQNSQEIKRITIKLTNTNKQKFEWRYSSEHHRNALRIKDEIGIKDIATLRERLTLNASMTKEELLAQVTQALPLPTPIKSLQVEVKFVNGHEMESEDESSDDDSDDQGDDHGSHGEDD